MDKYGEEVLNDIFIEMPGPDITPVYPFVGEGNAMGLAGGNGTQKNKKRENIMKRFGADNLKGFFMGLGMGIALLLMLGVGNMQADNDPIFNSVTAERFVLSDSNGNSRGGMAVNENVVGLILSNQNGEPQLTLMIDENGHPSVLLSGKNDKRSIVLGEDIDGNGLLKIYNADGNELAYLGMLEVEQGKPSNVLKLYNPSGTTVAMLGSTFDNDGFIGIFDRYGEVVWGKEGRK